MAAIIELDGVALRFPNMGHPVFVDIDLAIDKGEFVIVVGASGAGKSTLLRVIAGLVEASAGVVHRNIDDTGGGRRSIAMVFQEARLMPWRNVRRNVALGLEGLELDADERERRITEALALVGLAEYGERWSHELSGGQRQRVGIARALAVHPELLLMDEPFGALDAITRQALQDELLRIWRETGKSILFVTHDIEEAIYLGDRVLLLGDTPARIVESFTVEAPRPRQRGTASALDLSVRVKRQLSGLFEQGQGT